MTSVSEILVISSSSEKERWNPFEFISVKITYQEKRNVDLRVKHTCTPWNALFTWTRNLGHSKTKKISGSSKAISKSCCHIKNPQIRGFELKRSTWQTIRLSGRSIYIISVSLTHSITTVLTTFMFSTTHTYMYKCTQTRGLYFIYYKSYTRKTKWLISNRKWNVNLQHGILGYTTQFCYTAQVVVYNAVRG